MGREPLLSLIKILCEVFVSSVVMIVQSSIDYSGSELQS